MCRGFLQQCGGLSLWYDCIHESEDKPFSNTIVEKKNYHYETYQLHDGKESKNIKLMTSQMTMHTYNIHLNDHIVYVVL